MMWQVNMEMQSCNYHKNSAYGVDISSEYKYLFNNVCRLLKKY